MKEESREININGLDVTVFSDGSIEKPVRGKLKRQLGGKHKGYRQLNINGKTCLVHRVIAEAFLDDYSGQLMVDHINGDGEDNRLSNLRMVTNRENCLGFRRKRKGASSKYRGVTWSKARKKWCAHIKDVDTQINIGGFQCEKDAAIAWNQMAEKLGYPQEALNIVS